MQKEVLRFVHPDYEVIVRTRDISYSWKRFEGRINHTRFTNLTLNSLSPTSTAAIHRRIAANFAYTTLSQNVRLMTRLLLSSLKAKSGTIFGRLSLKRANIKCVCSFMV